MLLCFGKDCCASGKLLVFWKRLLCSRIDCCVLEKIVVFSKRLLRCPKDCCVLQKILALSKRLLCSSKDCCVSEQKLSCVLPLWATVLNQSECRNCCLYIINPEINTSERVAHHSQDTNWNAELPNTNSVEETLLTSDAALPVQQ